MAVVSRLQLNHPALGTAGGASLHSSIEALYQKIGDAVSSRWFQITDFDNGESFDLEHNFDTDIENLRWKLYVYTGGAWVLVTDQSSPAKSAFTVSETVGFEDIKLTLTNVSGGNDLLAAFIVVNDVLSLEDGDIKDVDVAGAEDGQALVYDSALDKFKPGASGDSSFKIQGVTDPNATIKGGYLMIDDERELATYDGAGSASTDFGTDLTVNLDTIFGGNPADATAYYLYIDLQTLGSQVTQTDTGRKVYAVVQANLVLSTTAPESRDPRRYVPLGVIRSANTGTVWSGTGATFKTLATRRHETLTRFFAYPETFVDESITTATATNTINHNLSGEPHSIMLTYDDGSTEIGLDLNDHLTDVTATQIKISSLGLTFGSGQKVRVRAVRFPAQTAIATSSRQFVSGWYENTSTTTVPHGLNDMDDVKGYEVQEWNTTTGRIKNIDRSALVINFDGTNFYLNWTGLTPSATLKYRIVAGGSPLPAAVPIQYGGYTKFVGVGPGSYATLTAAVAASASGDSILVVRDTTEPTGDLTIGVSNLRIVQMPNTKIGMSGAMTNGLRLTAAKIRIENLLLEVNPSGTQARGMSIEAADAWVSGKLEKIGAQTVTDGVHVTSGGSRTYAQVAVQVSAGAVTNLLTNNDGASNASVWGG